MKEKTYTLELHVPVLGSSIVLSSHLATLKTRIPHSVTIDYFGLKYHCSQQQDNLVQAGMQNKQQSNMLPMLRSPHKGTPALSCNIKGFTTTRIISSPFNTSLTQHTSREQGIYLNNDVILLEGLIVEEAVQHILGSSSIPHLQTS